MEVILGVLVFIVSTLAVLQGWQMVSARRNKNSRDNPGISNRLDNRLDIVITILGKMEQRLEDIWYKVNK
jgi:hypothetical protein